MIRATSIFIAAAAVLILAFAVPALRSTQTPGSPAKAKPKPPAGIQGWIIPPEAPKTKNPVTATPDTLASGKKIFEDKCERCHGAEGKGDGPDADTDHKPDDLSDARRAARNPDGVMFYKIWNGRKKPKMPAFKSDLTREQVWAVVHYAKSLRQESTAGR